MNKTVINVPRGIRYISDWSKIPGGYKLEDFQEPHILDKKLTGCGFTEYCLTNDMNLVLCSPRKVLLENKKDQHSQDVNVIYFNWDEAGVSYDKDVSSVKIDDTELAAIQKLSREIENGSLNIGKDEEDDPEKKLRLQMYRDSFRNQIQGLVGSGMKCKILVTYDSFKHIREILEKIGLLQDFYIVVDEFQSIFTDSRFKSEAELDLLYYLGGISKLCFVSATPMMENFLDELDEFKSLPYYELDWTAEDEGRIMKPAIEVTKCNSLVTVAGKIIKSYRNGEFEKSITLDQNGNPVEVESKEVVIYVNSVRSICSLIVKYKLLPDEVNILCSNTVSNRSKILKAFDEIKVDVKDIEFGVVPKLGEQHKMFTLCTRTVYLGADFYSTCARTVILSDANVDCMAVDISLDLPQILGRQRLERNPWKNRAELYYKTTRDAGMTRQEFNDLVKSKLDYSNELLGTYSDVPEENKRRKFALSITYKIAQDRALYSVTYVAVTKRGKEMVPVLNKLAMISEIRAYEIQQVDYRDRVSIFSNLSQNYIIQTNLVEAKYSEIKGNSTFRERLKLVCTTGFDPATQKVLLDQLPIEYSNFYYVLGPDKCRANEYKRSLLASEYNKCLDRGKTELINKIHETFIIGEVYLKRTIKQKLGDIYNEMEITRVPKATDLGKYFKLKECNTYDGSGKRVKGYEIIGRN